MEKREIDLTVSCYGKVKGVKYDVVILPWGATEPHNLHLPYLTDCILPHDIAVDAAAFGFTEFRCTLHGGCLPYLSVHTIRGSANFRSASIPAIPPSRPFWKT